MRTFTGSWGCGERKPKREPGLSVFWRWLEMEMLKALIPGEMKRRIYESIADDLPSTCSSLLEFFRTLPQFQQVVRELSDPDLGMCGKDRESAAAMKEKGNVSFRSGDYPEALRSYTKALCLSPMDINDMNKNLVATLFVNRASAMHVGLVEHKTRYHHGLQESAVDNERGFYYFNRVVVSQYFTRRWDFSKSPSRDCNRALVVFPCYGKAWYRRGKANASLQNHGHAIMDMNLALKMENSSVGRRQVESELQAMIQNYKKSETCSFHGEKRDMGFEYVVESSHEELHTVSSLNKGKGMVSKKDIFPNSLIHSEEPYAAVIFKHYRETHCHFCFGELPADIVPCTSCRISLYCSQSCEELAVGRKFCDTGTIDISSIENLSPDLIKYISDINLFLLSAGAATEANLAQFPEHRHECLGANWPAVLPSEIVLAGRIIAHSLEKERYIMKGIKFERELELCHHYGLAPYEEKLEWHIYSIVLMYCLKVFYDLDFSKIGPSVSQLVILIAQINVNSMAVVCIKSLVASGLSNCLSKHLASAESLTPIQQVKVGQAVYLKGSLFNHSCQPNVHAYFLSRTLFMRATEHIPRESPLEISYGPELGKDDLKDRWQLLESRYSFICQCRCCSELNFPDLVLHAFRCVRSDCFGAVLDYSVVKRVRLATNCSQRVVQISKWELGLPVCKQKRATINKVACLLLSESEHDCQIDPGCCLNCRSYRDMESSSVMTNKIKTEFERLQSMIISNEVTSQMIAEALASLGVLRSIMHPYSKDVAQAEDHLAEAFCSMGKPQAALPHCKASTKILEKLYDSHHIAVANEFLKLATLYMTLDDNVSALDIIKRVIDTFMLFYGSHYKKISPFLVNLRWEIEKISSTRLSGSTVCCF